MNEEQRILKRGCLQPPEGVLSADSSQLPTRIKIKAAWLCPSFTMKSHSTYEVSYTWMKQLLVDLQKMNSIFHILWGFSLKLKFCTLRWEKKETLNIMTIEQFQSNNSLCKEDCLLFAIWFRSNHCLDIGSVLSRHQFVHLSNVQVNMNLSVFFSFYSTPTRRRKVVEFRFESRRIWQKKLFRVNLIIIIYVRDKQSNVCSNCHSWLAKQWWAQPIFPRWNLNWFRVEASGWSVKSSFVICLIETSSRNSISGERWSSIGQAWGDFSCFHRRNDLKSLSFVQILTLCAYNVVLEPQLGLYSVGSRKSCWQNNNK